MHILITGGTGFIGKTLTEKLIEKGHHLTILTRQPHLTASQAVQFCHSLANFQTLDEFDAVINLAGEPIFDKAWTPFQKQQLTESRLSITQTLATLIQKSECPPHTFLSGSAIGFYGDLPPSANFYDESTACGDHFSAQLCQQWEKAALTAQSEKTRVCLLRTGMVFSLKSGGALARMKPFYRWGLGGKVGSGEQYWAWIALEDYVQAVIFLLENANVRGAVNLNAPVPVKNRDFNHWFAKRLNRFAFCHVPAWIVRLIFGERAQLLLDNQQVIPAKLLAASFQFRYQTLNEYEKG